jgi:hypothetical protein
MGLKCQDPLCEEGVPIQHAFLFMAVTSFKLPYMQHGQRKYSSRNPAITLSTAGRHPARGRPAQN